MLNRFNRSSLFYSVVAGCFVVNCVPSTTNAQLLDIVSYQGEFDKSDVVVIARADSTQKTAEAINLSSFATYGYTAHETQVPASGFETTCIIEAVLKGDETLKDINVRGVDRPPHIQVHYYIVNGYESAETLKQDDKYLMFLKREEDGRYAPASGKALPRVTAINRLE